MIPVSMPRPRRLRRWHDPASAETCGGLRQFAQGVVLAGRMRPLDYGEVAEWSKALDWNSSYVRKGIRGFESHPLRQMPMVARIGSFATICHESRQARKGATVMIGLCAEVPAGAGRLQIFGKAA